MNTQAEKSEAVQLILDTDNSNVLKKVKALLKKYVSSETDYLLYTKANKERLTTSIGQLNKGKGRAIKTADLWK